MTVQDVLDEMRQEEAEQKRQESLPAEDRGGEWDTQTGWGLEDEESDRPKDENETDQKQNRDVTWETFEGRLAAAGEKTR